MHWVRDCLLDHRSPINLVPIVLHEACLSLLVTRDSTSPIKNCATEDKMTTILIMYANSLRVRISIVTYVHTYEFMAGSW